MIDDLDEALRGLLVRELPIQGGQIDIAFDQPRREWSSRLTRPTLNLFLHDVRENTVLRASGTWAVERNGQGGYTRHFAPRRLDLNYMVTAWAADPLDEHRLLAGALLVLFRFPELPEDLLPESLQAQPVPIPMTAAQSDSLRNPADVWSAMDNELRPAVALVVTLAIQPYDVIHGPLVRTRELRIGPQAGLPTVQAGSGEAEGADRLWMVGGTIRGEADPQALVLNLLERGLTVPVRPDGRFVVGNLQPGAYTLAVEVAGEEAARRKIEVPSPSYDIDL